MIERGVQFVTMFGTGIVTFLGARSLLSLSPPCLRGRSLPTRRTSVAPCIKCSFEFECLSALAATENSLIDACIPMVPPVQTGFAGNGSEMVRVLPSQLSTPNVDA